MKMCIKYCKGLFSAGLILVVLVGFLFVAGCDKNDCQTSKDCSEGQICLKNKCLKSTFPDKAQQQDSDEDTSTSSFPNPGGDSDTDTDSDSDADSDTYEQVGDGYLGGPCETVADCAEPEEECTNTFCTNDLCFYTPASNTECTLDGDNPCQAGFCSDGTCVGTPIMEGGSCDDTGLYCAGQKTCINGVCTAEEGSVPCSSPDPCRERTCSEPETTGEEGTCGDWESEDNGDACGDDGVFCNGDDVCKTGSCTGIEPACSGVAHDECEEISCVEADDSCPKTPLTDSTPCPDNILCDGYERCQGGVCPENGIPACLSSESCVTIPCAEPVGGGEEAVCSWGEGVVTSDGEQCDMDNPCAGEGIHRCIDGTCSYSENPPESCGLWGDGNFCTVYYKKCDPAGDGGVSCYNPPEHSGTVELSPPVLSLTGIDTYGFDTRQEYNDVENYGSSCEGAFTGGEALFEVETVVDDWYGAIILVDHSNSSAQNVKILLVTDLCDPISTCQAVSTWEDVGEQGHYLVFQGAGSGQFLVVDGLGNGRAMGDIYLMSAEDPNP